MKHILMNYTWMLDSSYVKTANDLCESSHQDYYIVFNVSE